MHFARHLSLEDFLPFQNCLWMGLMVPCARNPGALIRASLDPHLQGCVAVYKDEFKLRDLRRCAKRLDDEGFASFLGSYESTTDEGRLCEGTTYEMQDGGQRVRVIIVFILLLAANSYILF